MGDRDPPKPPIQGAQPEQPAPPRRDPAADRGDRPPRGFGSLVARAVLITAGIGIVLAVMYVLRHLLLVIFLGVTLAAALYPAVSWLEKKRMPRGVAIAVPYLLVLAFFALAGFLIVPPLLGQIRELIEDLPSLVESLRGWGTGLLDRVGVESSDDLFGRVSGELGTLLPNLGSLLQVPLTVVGAIGDLAVVIVTSFLMLLERDRIRRWTVRFLPEPRRPVFLDESEKSLQKVGRYVLGQLILMTVIGIGTGLGMFILGIPFALPIGLLGFLGEIVPYFGPLVAGVPAVILGFISSPLDGLIMGGWLIALQALESYVLSPIVQHKVLRVSPLAVVIVVVAALALFGILGAIVAVPLVAIADVIIQDVVFPWRDRRSAASH